MLTKLLLYNRKYGSGTMYHSIFVFGSRLYFYLRRCFRFSARLLCLVLVRSYLQNIAGNSLALNPNNCSNQVSFAWTSFLLFYYYCNTLKLKLTGFVQKVSDHNFSGSPIGRSAHSPGKSVVVVLSCKRAKACLASELSFGQDRHKTETRL